MIGPIGPSGWVLSATTNWQQEWVCCCWFSLRVGKTTLMEYLAATMGLHLSKLIMARLMGHRITASTRPEAAIQELKAELEKSISPLRWQTTSCAVCRWYPTLQSWISTAVYLTGRRTVPRLMAYSRLESKTYDLRVKDSAVMAGNPYTRKR